MSKSKRSFYESVAGVGTELYSSQSGQLKSVYSFICMYHYPKNAISDGCSTYGAISRLGRMDGSPGGVKYTVLIIILKTHHHHQRH